jgi:hypothetical protein
MTSERSALVNCEVFSGTLFFSLAVCVAGFQGLQRGQKKQNTNRDHPSHV